MASIEKRSENTYRITVSCGYGQNGKKLFKKKTVTLEPNLTPKQREKRLNELAVLFEREVENGTYLDGDRITFGEFIERWLSDYAEKQLAPSTLRRYRKLLKRIVECLGHIKLTKLQPHHLLEFYSNLSEVGARTDCTYTLKEEYCTALTSGIKDIAEKTDIKIRTLTQLSNGNPTNRKTVDKLTGYFKQPTEKLFTLHGEPAGLSNRTILHHHRLISAMLNTAVQWQLVTDNPCRRVKPPKVEEKEAAHYEEFQVAEMFALLANEPLKYQCAVYIALYGGLRLGEVVGLDWTDVDFTKKALTISKSRQYVDGVGSIEKGTKNRSSNRTIDLSDSVLNILKHYKIEQAEERLKLGDLWIDSGKIFVQWNGAPMFPTTPTHWFSKWIAKKNLPKITFHQLRHTNASLLISEGVDIVTVSRRLGHSKPSTTTDIYSHAISKRNREAADKLESLFKIDVNFNTKV